MKRIIEIPDKVVEAIQNGEDYRYDIHTAIAQSKPCDDSGDLIIREALKDEVRKHAEYYADRTEEDRYNVGYTECACEILDFIDNAPTVEEVSVIEFKEPLPLVKAQKIVRFLSKRPQGECKTCIHRDPEDKKCDCGALERAGCPFPVSDDYFCKFYEKGGAE